MEQGKHTESIENQAIKDKESAEVQDIISRNYHKLQELEDEQQIQVSRNFCYATFIYYRLFHKLNDELLDIFVNVNYEEKPEDVSTFTFGVKDAKTFFALLPEKKKKKSIFYEVSKKVEISTQKEAPIQKKKV